MVSKLALPFTAFFVVVLAVAAAPSEKTPSAAFAAQCEHRQASFKHAKPLCRAFAVESNAQSVPMHGWASRLDVEVEAKAFNDRIAEHHGLSSSSKRSSIYMMDPSSNTSFLSGNYWFASTWHWLSSLFGGHRTVQRPTTTTYKDTLPRFVSYGDSYVDSNSFGVPDPKKLKGFTYYNIAFWTSTGVEDNVQEWAKASDKQQKAIVKAYNDAGIRLGIAAFGATDRPQSNGNDPWDLGDKIARFIKNNNLQGVDVDYEEYGKFEKKQATKWIIPLTRALRAALPAESYYISHAPIAPLFSTSDYPLGYTWVEQRIGSLIDFYNVQFYNQQDYLTCQSTTIKSTNYAKTSLLQLNSVYKIPLNKIVVGKPAQKDDADDGYLTAQGLGNCLAKYAVPAGWNAGCMWWEYRGDLQSIITPIKEALKV